MNLKKLFKLQAELDRRIEAEHPRQPGEDRLAKKVLALLVELGELANEWRGFKFWSNDQKPRNEILTNCEEENADVWQCGNLSKCGAKFETETFLKCCPICGWDTIIPMRKHNQLLEEYVDCLHFILSIGLEIEVSDEDIEIALEIKENQTSQNTFDQFVLVINWANSMHDDNYYHELLASFIVLGEMLGFTPEQIEEAYFEKNAVNHERQEEGY
ncbi:dUTP diphosphatase [Caenibacillus caldisaponilyticus]|uniref:dUTP diphosphatase n=1 Tax=Caenibacillus caldisaponilyticus TaxID=1674942 RepID=UPI00098873B1|nr:dUTP diphosphatase [Caenibacillus caldisaponilyticus]